jgi:hypothetical protein
MRSCHSLDAVEVTFSDEHLVANAGLMLPATLAQHLGLLGLFEAHVDLGNAPGRANVGHKAMTLIHSALLGGDSIDDADALRAGETQAVLGHAVLAPSTLGTFLRSFTWGHARQLDVVAGELLKRAWAAGAGPGSRSMSTRRSTRPTAWPNKAGPVSPTTSSVDITRCMRLVQRLETSSTFVSEAETLMPGAELQAFFQRPSSGFVTRDPPGRSC